MEQVALLDVLRRRLWLIVGLAVIATVVGYGVCLLLPNRYTAPALVLVRPQQPINMGTTKDTKEFLDFPMGSASVMESPSKTYIEIIKSPALLSEVVRELGMDKQAEPESGRLSKLIPGFDNIKQSLKNLPGILLYGKALDDDDFTKAVKELSAGLKMQSITDTYLFEISYAAKEPQQAAVVANTTAKTLIHFVNQLREAESRYQGNHLKVELDQRQQHLNEARQRLESYKKAHSVFLYESEYDSKLKLIADLQLELAKADASLVAGQNTLGTVALAAKRARFARLITERQAELAAAPQVEREVKELDEAVKVALTAYEMVDKEHKQADINMSEATPEARLVSAAVVPNLPSAPPRATITLACLLGGVIAGVGLAFVLEYLNRGIRSIGDIEDFVGVKVIATIPRVLRRRWEHAGLL